MMDILIKKINNIILITLILIIYCILVPALYQLFYLIIVSLLKIPQIILNVFLIIIIPFAIVIYIWNKNYEDNI